MSVVNMDQFKLLNEETLSNLKEGIYAIFINGILTETIVIENDVDYPVSAIMGSDEIYTAKEFMKGYSNLDDMCTIINAKEIYYENIN